MNEFKAEIDVIIASFLAGEADEASVLKLERWLSETEENRIHFEIIKAAWKESSAEPRPINADEIFEKIWKEGTKDKNVKGSGPQRFFNYFPKVAAALIIFIIAPVIAYLLGETQKVEKKQDPLVYVVKENPASQRSRFMLPDGSMVWLNCKSSLRYLQNFSTAERKVELVGEAFFEVTKDPSRPFIVYSGDLSTTALGTSFNVDAYPDKDVIEVALITGKIRIKNSESNDQLAVLDAGMGIRYDKDHESVTQNKVDQNKILAWKSGILIFDGDTFDEFRWKIEQWYDVTVEVHGRVPDNWRIRGRFDNEYLANILDVISFNKNFDYKLNDKQLTLNFKK